MYRLILSAVVVASLATAAYGQATWNPTYGGCGYWHGGDMALVWDGATIVQTYTQNANGYNWTYDATVLPTYPPAPGATVAFGMESRGYFNVGPIPVQATLTLNVNGKLVNGGGDASHPVTQISWGTALYYDLDNDHMISMGDVSVPAFSLNTGATLTGNGLQVLNNTQAMSSSFILAPEFSYILRTVQMWSMSDLPTAPMASTFEAGGETSFNGITLTLTATPVPEPGSALLLAAGGLLGAWFKRRRR